MSDASTHDPPRGGRRRSLFDPISRVVDAVVPTVADAVDVDDLVTRIDVDALIDRVDIDHLVARIDVDKVLGRVDVDALVDRVDVNQLLDRVDVNRVLDRVDVDRMLDRVDVDQFLARVDLNELMARVDVDAIVDRVDVDRIVQRADLAGVVAQSTRGITASTVDLVRRQIAGVDEVITRVAARVVGRDPTLDPDAPTELRDVAPPRRPGRDRPSITGHYAGPVARLAAFGLDWAAMLFAFGAFAAMAGWLLDLLISDDRAWTIDPPWSTLLLVMWAFVYFTVPLAMTGSTLGKAVVGLRVVGRSGQPLRPPQAVLRVLSLPLSIVLLGLGLIGTVVGRERRALHDVIARSVEVVDWGDRPAALPSPLSNWLDRRASTPSEPTGPDKLDA